jgi:hypothetical protein
VHGCAGGGSGAAGGGAGPAAGKGLGLSRRGGAGREGERNRASGAAGADRSGSDPADHSAGGGALSRTCNIKASARWAGISYGALYSHRKRWPDFERRWLDALKRGHRELDHAVLSTSISFMSGEGIPEGSPFSSMTVMDAIRYLNMQKYSVYGSGRPPGVRRR